MQPTADLSSFVPYIIGAGVCLTLVTVSIVIARSLTLNTPPLILKITSVILALTTLFFYSVVWLASTLLSPTSDSTSTILICYLLTGIIPSVFLYTKTGSPTTNITYKEKNNEQ
jgi:hypothetical protein